MLRATTGVATIARRRADGGHWDGGVVGTSSDWAREFGWCGVVAVDK